ncbi:MAG: hypothetical protein MRY83_22500 [Flavobacteriales bacterium]|nr:hypothetical protein [Flavobacteriales bacterium]
MTRFTKIPDIKIFLRLARAGTLLCLGLYVILAIIWKSPFFPLAIVSVFQGFVLIVAFIELKTKAFTNDVKVDQHQVIVSAKNKEHTFRVEDTEFRLFRIKNRSRGVRLMDNNKIVGIWKSGFTNTDWDELIGQLQLLKKFESEIYDYTGFVWNKRGKSEKEKNTNK